MPGCLTRNQKRLNRKLSPDAYLHQVAAHITLPDLLNMDEQYYRGKVQTLIYGYFWEKKFLQRNAAIALGNSGGPEALPHLEQAMEDPEEMVRAYAAWALGRLNDGAGRPALESFLGKEPSPQVKQEIRRALTQ